MNNKIFAVIVFIIVFLFGFMILRSNPQKQAQKQTQGLQTAQQPTLESQQENQPENSQQNMQNNTKSLPKPEMQIDQTKNYTAVFDTSEGEITIELFADKTPITVNNFIYLAENNFYDNTIFHRVISGFMIQGGDQAGNGSGGPGYKFEDEPFEGEYTRGTVAMANAGLNTNGSQFFIMHQDYELPKNYVIFGKVVKGMEVVDKIAQAEVKPNTFGENSTPTNPVTVNSVEIIEQ